jgi:xanthine dehydrogenase accessory factor
MRELLSDLDRWVLDRGEHVALATVVRVFRAAPRPEGAKLAISVRGELSGSVSGGCVEAGVVEDAQSVLETGQPKLLRFGIQDDVAWAEGLTCGGAIEVLVELLEAPHYRRLRQLITDDQPAVIATVAGASGDFPLGAKLVITETSTWVEGSQPDGAETSEARTAGDPARAKHRHLQEQIVEDARVRLRLGHAAESELQTYPRDGSAREDSLQVFFDVFPRRPHLAIFGAVHVAIPLVRFAREVGFRTTVVDPRSPFTTPERLGHADSLIRAWPQDAITSGELQLDQSSYVAVLTHDPKLDEPAIRYALQAGARYVGAIGSRRTQADRATRLRAAGLSEAQVEGIRGPIGLNIGARTPEEIAVSIIGELVAAARGVLKTT